MAIINEAFLQKLQQLFKRPDVDIWLADESGFEGDPPIYSKASNLFNT
jgi:hypothetical protein